MASVVIRNTPAVNLAPQDRHNIRTLHLKTVKALGLVIPPTHGMQIVRAEPRAVLLVVTDLDPSADIASDTCGHATVLSAGMYLDTQRFRVQLGRKRYWLKALAVEGYVSAKEHTAATSMAS
jgi:hypothetical protein